MKPTRHKVLLATSRGDIGGRLNATLAKKYELQEAQTHDQLYFLTQEWEPSVLIADSQLCPPETLRALRDLFPFEVLGIIYIALGTPSQQTTHQEREAFTSGADYFVVEREHLGEAVSWRIQSLIKRLAAHPEESVDVGTRLTLESLEVFVEEHLVKRKGLVVDLTPLQFKLLITFLAHKDLLLNRKWLKSVVWGDHSQISPRSIDAHISKLKKVVPELNSHLKNVYGKGYIFTDNKVAA